MITCFLTSDIIRTRPVANIRVIYNAIEIFHKASWRLLEDAMKICNEQWAASPTTNAHHDAFLAHALAREVFFGQQGLFRERDYVGQLNRATCMSLIINFQDINYAIKVSQFK